MFVLGFDPGVSRCGYGCVEQQAGGRARLTDQGVLTTSPSDPLPQRLASLQREVKGLLGRHRPAVVAVERMFFQVNARTAVSVAQASGLILAAAAEASCEVVEYTPNEVKQAVAGYGAAPKEQVQRMVQALLQLPTLPRPPDVADALALALCHLAVAPLRARIDRVQVGGGRGRGRVGSGR
jgi:crossover junction endodeoxyribonuclease RuvC